MAKPEVVDRLERNLMSLGVYVERHALEPVDGDGREEPLLHVEYETAAAALAQGDIGNVCSELVAAHGDGWEPRDVRFWVFTTDAVGFHGHWEVHGGWFRALSAGHITQTDFSTLVLSTRQPAEEPPAPVPGPYPEGE